MILVYGATLFCFVLAFVGFYLGFTLTMIGLPWLGDNAPGQAVQVMIAAVLGAVAGLTPYSLVKITLCAAGAMLGLVIGLLVASMLPFSNA